MRTIDAYGQILQFSGFVQLSINNNSPGHSNTSMKLNGLFHPVMVIVPLIQDILESVPYHGVSAMWAIDEETPQQILTDIRRDILATLAYYDHSFTLLFHSSIASLLSLNHHHPLVAQTPQLRHRIPHPSSRSSSTTSFEPQNGQGFKKLI